MGAREAASILRPKETIVLDPDAMRVKIDELGYARQVFYCLTDDGRRAIGDLRQPLIAYTAIPEVAAGRHADNPRAMTRAPRSETEGRCVVFENGAKHADPNGWNWHPAEECGT